jgi:phosphoglycolate phosphatase
MHFIFDFDGTLINSFERIIEKFNLTANQFGLSPIHPDHIETLRDLSSKELIQHLNIPLYQIPRVILHARKALKEEIPTLSSFSNLPDILQKLHASNIHLSILTSNSMENVTTWLKIQGLDSYFHCIHTESYYFGKKRLLKNILKKYKIDKSKAFYIGDETRDIEAAKHNGIYSIAVTWGFNSEKALLQYEPHYLVRKPDELLNISEIFK